MSIKNIIDKIKNKKDVGVFIGVVFIMVILVIGLGFLI